jgi:hypothetical protein
MIGWVTEGGVGMRARQFWSTIVADASEVVARLVERLDREGVSFCVTGDVAANAYVEPVVSRDLDVAIAAEDLERILPSLEAEFQVERFPHSLNLSARGSDLRVQFQLDPRYAAFVPRAGRRTVLGVELPVAQVEDVLQGKVWAASDARRRASKRQKDLADIARLLESFPELRARVPEEILRRLV